MQITDTITHTAMLTYIFYSPIYMHTGKLTDVASRTWQDFEAQRSTLEAPKGGIEVTHVRMDSDHKGERIIVAPVRAYVICMCVYNTCTCVLMCREGHSISSSPMSCMCMTYMKHMCVYTHKCECECVRMNFHHRGECIILTQVRVFMIHVCEPACHTNTCMHTNAWLEWRAYHMTPMHVCA